MVKARKRPARRQSNARWWWVGGAIALVAVAAILWWVFANPASSSNPSSISTVNARDYHALAFHPNNPDVLFFGHHGGILQSNDGGKSWTPLPSIQQDAMSIAIPRSDPNDMTIAGHNVLSTSSDGGKTWRALTTNLPGTDIHAFTVNPNKPGEFYAFVVGFGLFTSADGGATWTNVSGAVPPTTTSLAISRDTPQIIYLGGGSQGLFRSGDGGKTWMAIVPAPFQAAISLALNDQNELFVTTERGVFKTADDGQTWKRSNVDTGVARALAISPSNPQRIAVVNEKGQVFRSDDGGSTWGN